MYCTIRKSYWSGDVWEWGMLGRSCERVGGGAFLFFLMGGRKSFWIEKKKKKERRKEGEGGLRENAVSFILSSSSFSSWGGMEAGRVFIPFFYYMQWVSFKLVYFRINNQYHKWACIWGCRGRVEIFFWELRKDNNTWIGFILNP